MTVRVWMRPSELGEQGYTIDFPADSYKQLKSGALMLLQENPDAEGDEDGALIVGRVEPDRYDAAVILEDTA